MYYEFNEDEEEGNPQEENVAVAQFGDEMRRLKQEQDAGNKNPVEQPQNQQLKKPVHIPQSLKMKFIILVRYFQKVGQVRGKKKNEVTQMFFDNFALKEDRHPQYTYTLLRLMMPFYDRDRGVYKLQEKAIAKLFHQALGLPESEYQRMANYKHASLQPYGAPVGDFPSVVHSVIEGFIFLLLEYYLKGFCRKDPSITIAEVDNLLDELAAAQDSKGQVAIVTRMIQKCTADELMWLVRIILKDLKIGLKHERVLEYYHPDAVDFFNVTSSIREVCREFEDRNHSLKNVLRLFHPIKPMLAARRAPLDIRQLLEGKEFVIETKYDGERIQCHFNPDQMRFFTRNAKDYTETYGPKVTAIVRQCVSAHSAILDGEIVVVEKATGAQVQFGMNKAVAREMEDEHNELQLCYKIFDVLYVKGSLQQSNYLIGFQGEECNMMKLKLSDRRKVLKRIIKTIPRHLELVSAIETNSFEDIISEFDKAIMRNEEGIIIKQMDTEYIPNERGTRWVKMKGDYLEGLTDTFDVIIIGGFFGEESHRTERFDQLDRITHFLLGVGAKIDRENPSNSIIYPFVKVGTGYTVQELSGLKTIRNKLRPHFVMREGRFKPTFVPQNWIPGVQERPDCYVDSPNHSIILELKAAELMRSNTFPTDYTLRFPRTAKVRHDKEWYEMMTLEHLQSMINQNEYSKKLKKRGPQQDDSGGSKQGSDDEIADPSQRVVKDSKKGKHAGRKPMENRGVVAVMREFQGPDISNINFESNIFQGYEFYIVNVKLQQYQKHDIESIILQHGGQIVQNFIIQSVTHLIASMIDFKVQTIVDKYPVIVLKPEWIIECIRRGKIASFSPRYILYAQEWIQKQNRQYYDQFGDSYYEDIDPVCLKEVMQNMPFNVKPESPSSKNLKNKLLQTKLKDPNNVLCSRRFFLWAQPHQMEDFELKMFKIKIIQKGGIVIERLDEKFDYIVLFPNNTFIQEKQIEEYLLRFPLINTTTLENLKNVLEN